MGPIQPMKALIKPVLVSIASQLGPHATQAREPKLWILMYHRVLPNTDARFANEEPGMLIQPETFAMHIQEVKRQFDLVRLGDWIAAKKRGDKLPAKACAITFDDGWRDNVEFAFPALQAESAPATLFAVADKIGTDFQFWPNIVAHLLMEGAAETLASHPLFQPALQTHISKAKTVSPDTIAAVIRQLKMHSDEAIFSALSALSWRELDCRPLPPALMSWQELTSMHDSGLVEIGSHTCSHKRLTDALSSAELAYEIVESKKILHERLKAPIELFCFPNGDYNTEALHLVEQHYQAAVTTRRGINLSNHATLHALTRIALHDEVSNNRRLFRARLSGWI